MKEVYVISATNQDGEQKFYGFSTVPYWTDITNAKFFNNLSGAMETLKLAEFKQDEIMSDGIKYPPYLIHSACNLNNEHQSGEVRIEIKKINLESMYSYVVKAKIQKPKNIIYEY